MQRVDSPQDSDTAIEAQIQAKGLNAPRVTPAQIDALKARLTAKLDYHHTSTFCHVFLDDKFYLATGHSACVSLENYNKDIGDRIAIEDAMKKATNQLWLLEGYALYKSQNTPHPLEAIARSFIDTHHVSCPEATANDKVYECAPELVEQLANVVGYYQYPEDQQ